MAGAQRHCFFCWLHVGVLSGGAHPMRGLVRPSAGAPGCWPFYVPGDISPFLLHVYRMNELLDFMQLLVATGPGIFGFSDSFSLFPVAFAVAWLAIPGAGEFRDKDTSKLRLAQELLT